MFYYPHQLAAIYPRNNNPKNLFGLILTLKGYFKFSGYWNSLRRFPVKQGILGHFEGYFLRFSGYFNLWRLSPKNNLTRFLGNIHITIAVVNFYRGSELLAPWWLTTRSVLVPQGLLDTLTFSKLGSTPTLVETEGSFRPRIKKSLLWLKRKTKKKLFLSFCKETRKWPKNRLSDPLSGQTAIIE